MFVKVFQRLYDRKRLNEKVSCYKRENGEREKKKFSWKIVCFQEEKFEK